MTEHDEQVNWERVRELREQGLDAATALAQTRTEHEVESAVEAIDLDDDGEATGSCPTAQSVEWVADNLENKSVKPSDAPSATSWGLLKWATSSPVSTAEFYKSVWSKMLPSRAELENQARYSDTGLEIAELARRISERAIDAGYEPPGCEHCNPAWHGPEAKHRQLISGLTKRKYDEQ